MKSLVFTFLLLGAATQSLLAGSDSEVAAHKSALDIAGAFANDGFKIRDGIWTGNIGGSRHVRIVQVNLFAGNQYWFCFGTTQNAKKVSLTIFDETGKAMETDPYLGEGNAAAGFSPQISGPYYVRMQELEGDQTDCCLLYCYK
jgi:hypothetical protein